MTDARVEAIPLASRCAAVKSRNIDLEDPVLHGPVDRDPFATRRRTGAKGLDLP